MELFDNSFKNGFEDTMTAAVILDNCVDKKLREDFFKSVVPHTIMEEKFVKLIELQKSLKSTAEMTEEKEIKTIAKSFDADFEKAGQK
jgi:hypothetical protein